MLPLFLETTQFSHHRCRFLTRPQRERHRYVSFQPRHQKENHVNGETVYVALANPSLLSTCAGGHFLRCPGDIRRTSQVSARSRSDKTRQEGSTVYGVEGPRLRSCIIVLYLGKYERVAFRREPFPRNLHILAPMFSTGCSGRSRPETCGCLCGEWHGSRGRGRRRETFLDFMVAQIIM
jgi:hypothetical protein